ncbi:hypothetical protein [Amycolatopsis jejuensis]|uniref:hypothetical protein n=1 Tax=Amycolatopsis jejuensis TaxID=330084 RepID=UPI0009FD8D3D
MSDPGDHTLRPSEALDEDDLRVDPLEAGVEPPEHWSAVHRGPAEIREEESDVPRLAEGDVQPSPVPGRPVAATPAEDLPETVENSDIEPVAPDSSVPHRDAASDHGEWADRAGGTVADAIRSAMARRS